MEGWKDAAAFQSELDTCLIAPLNNVNGYNRVLWKGKGGTRFTCSAVFGTKVSQATDIHRAGVSPALKTTSAAPWHHCSTKTEVLS